MFLWMMQMRFYKAFFPQKIIKKRRKVAVALAPASNRGYPPFGSCCNDPSFPMLWCLITDIPYDPCMLYMVTFTINIHQYTPNVSIYIYTIHGSYGYCNRCSKMFKVYDPNMLVPPSSHILLEPWSRFELCKADSAKATTS